MSFDSIDQRRHQLLAQAASRLNYFETNNTNTTKTLESTRRSPPRADSLLTKEEAQRNIPYNIYVNNKHIKTNSTFKTEAFKDDDDDDNYEYDTTRTHSENVCFILA